MSKTFMWRFFEVKLTSGRWVHFRFLLNVFLLLVRAISKLSVQSIVEKSTNDKNQNTLYTISCRTHVHIEILIYSKIGSRSSSRIEKVQWSEDDWRPSSCPQGTRRPEGHQPPWKGPWSRRRLGEDQAAALAGAQASWRAVRKCQHLQFQNWQLDFHRALAAEKEQIKKEEEARRAEVERQERLAAQAAAERQAEIDRKAAEEAHAAEEARFE